MHPANIACLTAARIDVCALANNHVLDSGYPGLAETLHVLHAAGIKTAGAGRNRADAEDPAIIELAPDRCIVVFSIGSGTSGIPPDWAATGDRAGVDFLDHLSETAAERFLERVARIKRRGDVVVASIHWGGNWGYEVPDSQIHFAHRLLEGDVALVHGHSSHHPRPIEVYNEKLVLYGCGDFLTDYEGIGGYEEFRGDLALMYFPTVDAETGRLVALQMTPIHVRRMQATHADRADAEWICESLIRASSRFQTEIELLAGDRRSGGALVLNGYGLPAIGR